MDVLMNEDDVLEFLLGYLARSRGFRFYCPNYGTQIVETGCAKFIKHEENATGNEDFIFEEEGDVAVIENAKQDVTPSIHLSETVLENPQFEEPVESQEQAVKNPELDDPQEPVQPMRSDRPRRSTVNLDYVYLQEADLTLEMRLIQQVLEKQWKVRMQTNGGKRC
ncbi:hypothetical protein L3X38_016878 [Prunus dulcis]|uniref:Uncharacterized protein n=1 Tax=Prunus dulcis TaxID=3755 RepID=A0AAD4W8S5_PRUDU|nr:hypothetical protein L3X38_016878 [Prunus dulcis]